MKVLRLNHRSVEAAELKAMRCARLYFVSIYPTTCECNRIKVNLGRRVRRQRTGLSPIKSRKADLTGPMNKGFNVNRATAIQRALTNTAICRTYLVVRIDDRLTGGIK
ncbi:MAG TPA: hypothetical protein PKV55_06110 [Nitrospira sp.]|nr:hypothetical protein [Nitrospira sp.]